ncbi:MAG: adenylyltransferase [Candidatus Methanomethylicota archaeon]|uniref:Adenylyltransferase n=1 Tax=Thermoproteota archaeon TaxID=2056631 RepID=A0A497EU03_9CREN|nr:MAG: adenylyltransferase [Candidatus Verstraetearchaeota archaeon]RLE50765.1 MAG: adenylyltransferase [Candidatus Verstraetearchaeota archaeon]
MLSDRELKRYDRQIKISNVGEEGQKKLKLAKVLVAGAGGLGSVASIYLAAAGIGHIVIVDKDKVDITNLNRQVVHWEEDIGKFKALSAAEKLRKLNSDVEIEGIVEEIREDNVDELLNGVNVVVDALDNYETRLLLNRAVVNKGIAMVHGAVHGFEGQVMTIIPGKTACLNCLYRGVKPRGFVPTIGIAPAVIGALEVTEVIKYLLGIGELLLNRMLIFDGEQMRFYEVQVQKDPMCPTCSRK